MQKCHKTLQRNVDQLKQLSENNYSLADHLLIMTLGRRKSHVQDQPSVCSYVALQPTPLTELSVLKTRKS